MRQNVKTAHDDVNHDENVIAAIGNTGGVAHDSVLCYCEMHSIINRHRYIDMMLIRLQLLVKSSGEARITTVY